MPLPTRRRGNKVKGVQFTVMVVGASGNGRTTFVNTLCESEVLAHKILDTPDNAHAEEKVRIKPVSVGKILASPYVGRFRWTIMHRARGRGCAHCADYRRHPLDSGTTLITSLREASFSPLFHVRTLKYASLRRFQEIVNYLERQYDDILAEQSRIKRNPRFRDNRVHALLYFIAPTGHHLREMDVELMRRLSPRVNVIPVIGRADSLTVMEDIDHYDIPIYNFPYDVEEDDEETIQENMELRALLPFAVIGSEEEIDVGGEPVRARIYPWGVAEVDNPDHSDFGRLRNAILSSHLADLKMLTEDVLYETYRTEKLSRSVHSDIRDSQILPEELATQSVRLKEEQLRRDEEKLREIELKVQREINEKRQELLAKEESLRNLESRLAAQGLTEGSY
ncbi:Chloride channel protein [Mycena sanguinolenta]|uniref:Chloride channel protein n=1 Tax=Mycena sanguinolenta TaxID=230812 RepID=A0A8H6ZGQ0_9AGAR|nr:Chloride channel protein [Mycena sanguinolenta]